MATYCYMGDDAGGCIRDGLERAFAGGVPQARRCVRFGQRRTESPEFGRSLSTAEEEVEEEGDCGSRTWLDSFRMVNVLDVAELLDNLAGLEHDVGYTWARAMAMVTLWGGESYLGAAAIEVNPTESEGHLI